MTLVNLNDVEIGQSVLITGIEDDDVAVQALRMGISVGEVVRCVARVPAGPTVIKKGGMELAIGRELCRQIEVTLQ